MTMKHSKEIWAADANHCPMDKTTGYEYSKNDIIKIILKN